MMDDDLIDDTNKQFLNEEDDAESDHPYKHGIAGARRKSLTQ